MEAGLLELQVWNARENAELMHCPQTSAGIKSKFGRRRDCIDPVPVSNRHPGAAPTRPLHYYGLTPSRSQLLDVPRPPG